MGMGRTGQRKRTLVEIWFAIAAVMLTAYVVLDGFDPDVHHLAADERLDRFSSVPREKPQPVHVVRAAIDAEFCQ